jgi:peptidoglycan/LPS O-acetylase OafA/YrhL
MDMLTLFRSHMIALLLLARYIRSIPLIAITAQAVTIVYSTISWFLRENPLLLLGARFPQTPRVAASPTIAHSD